ncbi:MAG: cysteine hydrolase [Candidatus Aminicenantes bacterium]|nr:cysteine hydrolase [Candidatus Aminicenantes bacterium]
MKAQNTEGSQTALLLIDIQYFYFPGARQPLWNPEEASLNAQKLLTYFRDTDQLVIHVRHNANTGGEIHENVAPLENEKIISKNSVNSFKDTDLLDFLKTHEVKKLVICGMMTHMCVEAAVRAAADYGFEVTLVQDACTTRTLKYGDTEIPAEAVHASTLASLSGTYAKVTDTETFLKDFI